MGLPYGVVAPCREQKSAHPKDVHVPKHLNPIRYGYIVNIEWKETKERWSALLQQYCQFTQFARPDRRYFILDVVAIVVAVATNAAMIWLMGRPLSLIQVGDYDALTGVLGLFAGMLLLNQAVQLGGGWLSNWLGLNFIGRLRNALMLRLLQLSFPVTGQWPRGDLLARLSNDVERVAAIVVTARLQLISHLLTLSIYIFMLFWIDTYLAMIALVTIPLFVLHQRFFSRRKRRVTEGFLKSSGELLAFEEQGLANLRGISANVAEARVSELHRGVFDKARRWMVMESGLAVAFNASFTMLVYLVGMVVVVVGVEGLRSGEISVGLMVSFILYLGYLTVPVRGLADIGFQFAGNVPAAERILEVIDARSMVAEKLDTPALVVTGGAIELRNVSFAYSGGGTVLRAARVCIAAGETVALVGPSGSGKSTFAALLLRFYDPQQGCILIDGQDLRQVSIESLRRSVAVVWQESFVVDASVRDNLRMARPLATEQQLIEACRRSHAWEFIEVLPQWLDTRLGAGGVELSSGQKQRLAIAQAFLRDAPILILDEASSALDSQSEQAIVLGLEALRAQRTTLIIAHRYSSIRTADRVIYFEGDGSFTVGRHDELAVQHEGYREAVAWQTG
jgi:ABC-type multidrug transport system fused ATPase/permease subunit